MKSKISSYKELEKKNVDLIKQNKFIGSDNISQIEEKEKFERELNTVNKDLALQKDEKKKQTTELQIANKKLAFQNEKIKKRAGELTQLNFDKDRFIEMLAHDLRSPFSSILGFLNLLLENIYKYNIAEIEKHIDSIRHSAQNTYNLLEDLISWAMSKSGKLAYNPDKLNFTELCKEEVELYKVSADSKKITIKCVMDDDIILVADKNMLKTIVRNLVSNSIKFTNSGGHIDINAVKTKSTLTLSVADNGIGIEPQILKKLFDVTGSLTTKGTENESGNGLGLMLCKIFTEKHGGTISVKSEVGKGSTFTLIIPTNQESKTNQRNKPDGK